MERPIITVQQHILDEQQNFPGVSGEFSWLLSGITLATKMIQAKVQRAGLSDILGSNANVNVQGETQQKLDVYANNVLYDRGPRHLPRKMPDQPRHSPSSYTDINGR